MSSPPVCLCGMDTNNFQTLTIQVCSSSLFKQHFNSYFGCNGHWFKCKYRCSYTLDNTLLRVFRIKLILIVTAPTLAVLNLWSSTLSFLFLHNHSILNSIPQFCFLFQTWFFPLHSYTTPLVCCSSYPDVYRTLTFLKWHHNKPK